MDISKSGLYWYGRDSHREVAHVWRTIGHVVAGDDAGLRMRSGERPFRELVEANDGSDGLAFAGWELPDADSLECAWTDTATWLRSRTCREARDGSASK
jgi:hypothetical protein